MNIKKKCWFQENGKRHGLIFNYNIKSDTFLVIGYIDIRCIPCRCS